MSEFIVLNIFFRFVARSNNSNSTARSPQVVSGSTVGGKGELAVALVKPGNELAKTTPAGEYLTTALNDFDPEQYEGLAAISNGAKKLLMLVYSRAHLLLWKLLVLVLRFFIACRKGPLGKIQFP